MDSGYRFLKFLAKQELTLPFAEASLLASKNISKTIYKRAESGLIGDFGDLVAEAAVLAINSGKERITDKEIMVCDFIPSSNKPTSENLEK